jgi:hypothetical protein
MATWGYGNFDNDSALDWLMDFAEEPALSKINSALNIVADNDGYADALDCEEALAAAEVIALLLKSGASDFPEEEITTIKNCGIVVDSKLKSEALEAIKKIILNSELKDIWEETDEVNHWLKVVSGLESRLKSAV